MNIPLKFKEENNNGMDVYVNARYFKKKDLEEWAKKDKGVNLIDDGTGSPPRCIRIGGHKLFVYFQEESYYSATMYTGTFFQYLEDMGNEIPEGIKKSLKTS